MNNETEFTLKTMDKEIDITIYKDNTVEIGIGGFLHMTEEYMSIELPEKNAIALYRMLAARFSEK